jgi:DNA-binding transcriptional LysR family regulator
MELRHLRYFVAVAEELHFGRAAGRLLVAQPSLSRQVRDLERELGVPLLSRAHRRVALTAAGEAFLEEARLTLARAAEAAEAARRAHRGEIGQLRVGFVQSATFHALPRLLRGFRTAYPDVDLAVRAMTTVEQVAAIRDQRIHVGLLRPPIDDRGITLSVISRDQLVVALPGGHPLAASERVSLAALADEPFILYARSEGPGVRDAIVAACLAAGFRPRVAQEAWDTPTIVALVGAGLGVSLLISPAPPSDGAVAYRPPAEDLPPWELALAWRRDHHSPVLDRFLETAPGAQKPGEGD